MSRYIANLKSLSLKRQLVTIFLLGAILSSISVILVHNYYDPGLRFGYESAKYLLPAIGFIETGGYNKKSYDGDWYVPELQRLPGYPMFLVLVYKIFGINNDLAVAFLQCCIVGLIAVAVALSAGVMRRSWLFPAGLLTACCPALFYRASGLIPGLLFAFFVIWGICAVLWALKGKRVVLLLCLAGVCFGLAHMTRPMMLFFPLFTTPFLILALRNSFIENKINYSWTMCIGMSLIPILIMGLFTIPWIMRNYEITGQPVFSVQTGMHAPVVYYCLAAKWGCGNRNPEAAKLIAKRIQEMKASLPEEDRNNPVILNEKVKNIAIELILDLPTLQLITATIGSTVKMMFHNVVYEIMERFNIPIVYLSRVSGSGLSYVANFFIIIGGNSWMLAWIVLEILLVFSRGLQLAGIVYYLGDKDMRWKILWLVGIALSFMAVAVGIGNNRYRIHIDPILYIFTAMGLGLLLKKLSSMRKRFILLRQPDAVGTA